MARVEFGEAFFSDMHAQIEHLAEAEEWSRADRLIEDVARVAERLSRFPEFGRQLGGSSGRTLRRIPVGRLPYLVWYRHDPRGAGVIRMARLYHMRQRTPAPRLD